jgi:hypothetical protein
MRSMPGWLARWKRTASARFPDSTKPPKENHDRYE